MHYTGPYCCTGPPYGRASDVEYINSDSEKSNGSIYPPLNLKIIYQISIRWEDIAYSAGRDKLEAPQAAVDF